MENELRQLIQSRGNLKRQLTRQVNSINKIDLSNINSAIAAECRQRQIKIMPLLDEFESIQFKIEALDSVTSIAEQESETETFENSYYTLIGKISEIITIYEAKSENFNLESASQVGAAHSKMSSQKGSDVSQVPTTNNNASEVRLITNQLANSHIKTQRVNVKLPPISLPKFSGNIEEWLSFYETFMSIIDKDESLPSILKLQYLKTSLEGEAASLLQSLEITALNYDVALNLLRDRFENSSRIVYNHVKSLFELESISRESGPQLQSLLNNTMKHMRALKSLKQPVDHWDTLMIYFTTTKLDPVSKREWEKIKSELSDLPTFKDLTSFLTKRCQLLESLHTTRKTVSTDKPNKFSTSHVSTDKLSCCICKENHPLYRCSKFLEMSVVNRINEATKNKLCKNCFKISHVTRNCKSLSTCKKCHKRHNTLLHLQNEPSAVPLTTRATDNNVNTNEQHTPIVNCSQHCFNEIVLPTAIAIACDNKGTEIKVRILLDSASQSNFIRQELFDKLCLPSTTVSLPIFGINNSKSSVSRQGTIFLKSCTSSFKCPVTCLIIPQITNYSVPSIDYISKYKIPNNLIIADPFLNDIKEIDILIGAELFWSLLCVGQMSLGKNNPIIQNTHFGWVISGPLPITKRWNSCLFSCALSVQDHSKLEIQQQLATFWKIEDTPSNTFLSKEEIECEEYFKATTTRANDGRFVVKLPFKQNVIELGASYSIAQRRYELLQKRLSTDFMLQKQYDTFMFEYAKLFHMSPHSYSNIENPLYLPHHAVVRPDKTTTKVRVVFDASCRTSSGLSLNNTLKVGPVVQPDLFTILIRFRLHKVAFTSDCEKMYRQIWLHKDHRIYQNIIWDNQVYQLNTVTYGTASAPYLATRCLLQIAEDVMNTYPAASAAIKQCFYVDDFIVSCPSLEKANTLISNTSCILSSYGFTMRKWASNYPQLLQGVDPLNSITHFTGAGESNQSCKTLGLDWDPDRDVFKYPIKQFDMASVATKRSILSTISAFFDPLGLISPVILKSKIILQRLWQLNCDWDDFVTPELNELWISHCRDFLDISKICIPRQVLSDDPLDVEIHAFADASEISYGCCIYLVSISASGERTVNLLCAKGRVAPLKLLTIPKLELMASHLAAKLVQQIKTKILINISKTYYWSDSSIVLAWLRKLPNQLKIFVAHRVSDILSLSDISEWFHVRSKDNPADILSRGATVNQLINSSIWWHGPQWLSQGPSSWPMSTIEFQNVKLPEMKSKLVACHSNNSEESFISRLIRNHSNLSKIQRILSYCLRFMNFCLKRVVKYTGPATVSELNFSMQLLIRQTQSDSFQDDIERLQNNNKLSKLSSLKMLCPFLDKNKLLRVGGRLRHSHLPQSQKFPLILPKEHLLTGLIIQYFHLLTLHSGPSMTLSAIRQHYWIISGSSAVKKFIHKCVRCKRFESKIITPFMGDLPANRVVPSRPFSICGTDFAGPFSLREGIGRGRKTTKGYLCIFVCFATKACHFEIVSSLSTEAFLACLKRFLARRGFCNEIHSDNGTNFVGAANEIKKWYKFQSDRDHIEAVINFLSKYLVQWKFIPARSPHFGGLWEAAVKSAKRHLYKVVGNSTFTFEELNTLCCQIEAVLNSRPLFPFSPDPEDMQILTPAHFLVGDSLMALPEPTLIDTKLTRVNRFKMVQQMLQRFWRLWSADYLTHLQKRTKWYCSQDDSNLLRPGSLVLLREPQVPPFLWKMGRIVNSHPGEDGIVRVVTVKTPRGTLTRAVTKVVPLLSEEVEKEVKN